MPLLDTSFLVDLARRLPAAVGRFEAMEEADEEGLVPSPVHFELSSWVAQDRRRRAGLGRRLVRLPVLQFDRHDAEEAGLIEVEQMRIGAEMGTVDTMVAGMARRRRETIITADRDYEKVRGLRVAVYR
jgi:tRNA(fMet)-specific endonuclease VapC